MTKILFVCLGNICRSPMAEFVLKDMVKRAGIAGEFEIASAATSDEELGNPALVSEITSRLRDYSDDDLRLILALLDRIK